MQLGCCTGQTGLAHGHVPVPERAPRVAVVWLESTAPGTAPAYHLLGTLRRLKVVGVPAPLVVADDSGGLRVRRLALFPWRIAHRRAVLRASGVPPTHAPLRGALASLGMSHLLEPRT